MIKTTKRQRKAEAPTGTIDNHAHGIQWTMVSGMKYITPTAKFRGGDVGYPLE